MTSKMQACLLGDLTGMLILHSNILICIGQLEIPLIYNHLINAVDYIDLKWGEKDVFLLLSHYSSY